MTTGSSLTAAPTSGFSLNDTGLAQIGTLTLTGTARNKTMVATYADRLAAVAGLTAPTPTSVTSGYGNPGRRLGRHLHHERDHQLQGARRPLRRQFDHHDVRHRRRHDRRQLTCRS